MTTDVEVLDHEPASSTEQAVQNDQLALKRPDVPVTLSELAALKGEALEIIEARVQVMATLRKAAIRATNPEDWLLFKAPDEQGGQIVGYLQDVGCERIRDLYGIEVFNVSSPERIAGSEANSFHYLITGSGRCKFTRQIVEQIEGGRSSTDDFLVGKSGAALELAVRKAARANLDGNIVRELAGMGSVPVEELHAAWAGTTKNIERCRRGRGFGSRTERLGGQAENVPNVEPPKCAVCGTVAKYRPAGGGRPAFFGCPNFRNHQEKKWAIDADKWIQQQAAATPQQAPPRDPGQEG